MSALKRLVFTAFLAVSLTTGGFSAITITSPAVQTNVKSCNEFSTDVLRDKWDMSRRTDLGWRIYNSVEEPRSFLTGISFSGGIFSARTVYTPGGAPNYSDCNISILDSHYPGSVPIGKVGTAYPIDADKYTVLVMRASFDPSTAGNLGVLYWSKDTMYSGISWSHTAYIYQGFALYYIDIPQLGQWGGTAGGWNGTVDSLRIDPIYEKDRTIQIDWIRLVEKDAALEKTISWSGNSGNVDIYLDNNSDPGDGTLGLLASNVSGTSRSFLAGGLEAGDYYAVVVPAGTLPSAGSAVSAGFFRVNDTPIVAFTKPTAEGSTEDFATQAFGDPWDMANLEDVEHTNHVTSPEFLTMSYYDQAGAFFADRTLFKGVSAEATPPLGGDPIVNVLFWFPGSRGENHPIDAERYHNLVATVGIGGGWAVAEGSIARVIWKKRGDELQNVSEDVILRHLNDNSAEWGQTVLNKIVLDMKTLPLDPGSPSTTGWGGLVEGLRIDPHEFSAPREFYFDDVKLTADWRANASFPISWDAVHSGGPVTVSLYYDTDNSGFDGTLIASGLTGTSATWDCSGVPSGTYWIYAVYTDGTNGGQCYAGGPVIVEHVGIPLIPQIQLSRSRINFGVVQGSGLVTSPAQVFITNAGQGTLNWSVTVPADKPFLRVSPASGTGDGVVTVSVDPASLGAVGPFQGTVTVTDPTASNSPQQIEIRGTVYSPGSTGLPFGDFATPIDGTTGVTGAVPVTGWVLDDIETTNVQIFREPVASDPPVVIGPNGLVYVGESVFVEGARPDVEQAFPGYPQNSRAGWGYMMLTNMLPGQGNGVFKIHAVAKDAEGNTVSLGAKTITCGNALGTKPFGTIDTPSQGGDASGAAFVNFGWALTPLPGTIPKDGSTIRVFVDSVFVGRLNTSPNVYNQYRSDVSTLFPGLNNTGGPGVGGPVGAFFLDTTKYANGVHSIAWAVMDDLGREDGIGSRYFNIVNLGGSPAAVGPDATLPTDTSGLLRIGLVSSPDSGDAEERRPRLVPVPIKRGARGSDPAEVTVEELGFVELRFRPEAVKGAGEDGLRFIGWGGDESHPLPAGSTLDPETGVFSWMPGPGFLGRHNLHFALSDGENKSAPIAVIVEIIPKKPRR
jgi:hypothetical protein